MTLRTIFLACMLASATHLQAAPRDLSQPLAAGQQALVEKDYATAHAAYLAHAGDNALAQFTLGMFEREGWGRKPDPVAACAWFGKAADAQVPAAMQFMGDCLAGGIGRAVDGPGAVQWYLKASAAGIAYASCVAGELFIEGAIVPRDVNRGMTLCAGAAQAESPRAMLKLADHYRLGDVLPQDLRLARYWYEQAAQRHDHQAQFWLGMMFSEGQGGPADLAGARFWLEHAAMEGHAPAYLPTAILYANAAVDPATGALTPDDLSKVYMWNSAARSSTANPAQLAEIARIDKLVLAVMPATWKPELDRRVAAHLAAHTEGQAR